MLRNASILVLSVLFALPACAETLAEAMARAVAHFPEIQAAGAREVAAQAQVGQARAELFPALNLTLGGGRERSRNVSTREQNVSLSRREGDVSATQLLFDGGAAIGQVRRFQARAIGANYTTIDTAQDAAFRAAQAYIEVRRLREQLVVARDNVGIHERTLGDVKILADAGKGRRVDVTQAEARRALAISAVDQLVGQLAQTEAAYKYLTGRLPGELLPPPELGGKLSRSLPEAVRDAIRTHPSVRSAEKDFEAAQFDRDSARARYALPRVTVEAGGSRNRDLDGIVGKNEDAYAMLRLRYNLFRGFGDAERLKEAEARIDEAVSQLGRARNEVERDVRQSWESLASDRSRLPQLADYARASADVAEAYRMQFQLGQRSLLDVLNGENERFNASSSYIAGQAAVSAGELRLLSSTGHLLQTFGINLPQQQPQQQPQPQAAPTPGPTP